MTCPETRTRILPSNRFLPLLSKTICLQFPLGRVVVCLQLQSVPPHCTVSRHLYRMTRQAEALPVSFIFQVQHVASTNCIYETAAPSSHTHTHPFISRPLNRTASQASSTRTHLSTQSSIPPNIPPLNLSPPFPGPHPNMNQDGAGPSLRPRKLSAPLLPTITGSSNEDNSGDYGSDENDRGSLHAESFVTADGSLHADDRPPSLARSSDVDLEAQLDDDADERSMTTVMGSVDQASLPSPNPAPSLPSASESFIRRRWDRDIGYGTDVVIFEVKRQWFPSTPAAWAFWIGFLCPVLWLVGGWHFTKFGEQPPRLTFWEFYFNAGYWKELLCCRRIRVKEDALAKGKMREREAFPLPSWVTDKHSSADKRARLNDPKRSLRGISFGYPFISKTVSAPTSTGCLDVALGTILHILSKPNRFLDQVYGVKLREVRGRGEAGRRVFDPWIQRCRYAFCYAMVLFCAGLCVASTALIIVNVRRFRS